MKPARVTRTRRAGRNHAVSTIVGGGSGYRRKPCQQCPFRVDQTGVFPAKAFLISAPTAYDAAQSTFACHMSGTAKPTICAGFLLRNAVNNLAVRIAMALKKIDPRKITDAGLELHESYRAMAEANGVRASHPALKLCRADDDFGGPR